MKMCARGVFMNDHHHPFYDTPIGGIPLFYCSLFAWIAFSGKVPLKDIVKTSIGFMNSPAHHIHTLLVRNCVDTGAGTHAHTHTHAQDQ